MTNQVSLLRPYHCSSVPTSLTPRFLTQTCHSSTCSFQQLLPPVDLVENTTFLLNSVTEPCQRTSCRFLTLITLGHIVSRKAFKKMCVGGVMTRSLFLSCLLQGTEPRQWYTTQFFWPASRQQPTKRQNGGKSIVVFSANKISPDSKMFLLWSRQLCLGKSLAMAYHWSEPQCCPVWYGSWWLWISISQGRQLCLYNTFLSCLHFWLAIPQLQYIYLLSLHTKNGGLHYLWEK